MATIKVPGPHGQEREALIMATVADALARMNFGTASAAKRGRNPGRPYVPVIRWASAAEALHQTTQIRGLAYATREEAVQRAQRAIDADRVEAERKLRTPHMRAFREHWGLPRDIKDLEG